MPREHPPDAVILALLRATEVHVLTGELAAAARLTPAEVAERVRALQQAGFEIERHPVLGLRLCGEPDRLIADDLWSRLPEKAELVREIVVLEETGSTNDVAASLGRKGARGGLLVAAERQTAGRGRFGRRWASAAQRGIWVSLLVRPALPLERWTHLTTWAAVSVAAALDRIAGTRAAIKWPNDVQLEGKKVAGMLIELGADDRQEPFAVVGIGVNVNHEPEDFPAELACSAASLKMAVGHAVHRPALLVAILAELEAREHALAHGFEGLIAEAEQRSSLLGRWVQVRAGETLLTGVAERLDCDGHLLLRDERGALVTLTAGEVTLRLEQPGQGSNR